MTMEHEPAPIAAGQPLAVVAESLYLANLLLVPGLSFLLLLWLHYRHRHSAPALARCHLRQAVAGSLWAGVFLIVINALILIGGGYDSPYLWMYLLLYFTVCHSTLILIGMLGLAKAMAGRFYRYPLIGAHCDG